MMSWVSSLCIAGSAFTVGGCEVFFKPDRQFVKAHPALGWTCSGLFQELVRLHAGSALDFFPQVSSGSGCFKGGGGG